MCLDGVQDVQKTSVTFSMIMLFYARKCRAEIKIKLNSASKTQAGRIEFLSLTSWSGCVQQTLAHRVA